MAKVQWQKITWQNEGKLYPLEDADKVHIIKYLLEQIFIYLKKICSNYA